MGRYKVLNKYMSFRRIRKWILKKSKTF